MADRKSILVQRRAVVILKGLALKILLENEQVERQFKDQTFIDLRFPRKEALELANIIAEI